MYIVMLEQRANHSITNHHRGDIERLQLQSGQSRTLVVRCGLSVVCPLELPNLVKTGNEAKSSAITLRTSYIFSILKELAAH